MNPRSLLGTALLFGAALAGVAATPRPAAACVWKIEHNFSPYPPCEVEDMPGHDRINQLNARLGSKLVVIAGKIQMVRREVAAWKGAYETAVGWRDEIRQLWGDATANPLPSMIAEYNRHAPLARYVRLSPNGEPELVDLRQMGEDALNQFRSELGALYEETAYIVGEQPERIRNDFTRLGAEAQQNITDLMDYRQYTSSIRDSLVTQGLQHAARYGGVTSPDGLSEAKISALTAILAQLQGTAFEAEARSVQSRLQALEGAASKRGIRLDAEANLRAITGGW